jgi:heat shock protein HtpX
MQGAWILLAVIAGLGALLLFWFVAVYNGLVSLRNHMQEAWAQIDVQLKRRHDLVPNLVETVKGYASHEKDTLERVVQARAAAVSARGVDQQVQAENMLSGALGRLMAIVERYPDLKANQNFLALQEELTSTENKVGFARTFYNDQVRAYNTKIQSIPDNIVAGMFNFREGTFFELESPPNAPSPKSSSDRLRTVTPHVGSDRRQSPPFILANHRDGRPAHRARRGPRGPARPAHRPPHWGRRRPHGLGGLFVTALAAGDRILLRSVGAREIAKADAPRLWNVVEEMCIASGLRTMPRVYIIENDAPNAFAAGRKPDLASIAVTSGLLRRLSRDELQGVIAHEIAHIQNLDIRFMMLAAVMVGSITLLADGFFRGMRHARFGGRRGGGRSNAQAQLLLFAIVLLLAVLAPILARALYFACSRQREYLADASAARYTRYPEGLASALEKIAGGASGLKSASRALSPMFIINPNQPMALGGMFATHPPTAKRVEILRRMAGGANYAAYEAAYEAVVGTKQALIGGRTLEADDPVPLREPAPEPAGAADELAEASREVLDLLDREAGFSLIPCACGVRMKLPPEYDGDTVTCPRCGRERALARVEIPPTPEPQAPLVFRRTTEGWESFKCACGRTVQLGPGFNAPRVRCPGCDRSIAVKP